MGLHGTQWNKIKRPHYFIHKNCNVYFCFNKRLKLPKKPEFDLTESFYFDEARFSSVSVYSSRKARHNEPQKQAVGFPQKISFFHFLPLCKNRRGLSRGKPRRRNCASRRDCWWLINAFPLLLFVQRWESVWLIGVLKWTAKSNMQILRDDWRCGKPLCAFASR